VENLNETFDKYRENLKNHGHCMTVNKIPRQMVNYQLRGLRNGGYPGKDGKIKPEEGAVTGLGA
jgi:hypothetical protein